MELRAQDGTVIAGAQHVAVAIIKQEHRTLATVVSALHQWLAKVAQQHAEPDFAFFAAALYYISDFPERFHHPKEEDFLFRALLRRTHRLDLVIDGLQGEHVRSGELIAAMEHALVHYQGGAPSGLEVFRAAVDTYAAMLGEHMHKEEVLLAEAAQYLEVGDWQEIAAAFIVNDDPLYGVRASAEFGKLYARIVNALPAKLRPALHN